MRCKDAVIKDVGDYLWKEWNMRINLFVVAHRCLKRTAMLLNAVFDHGVHLANPKNQIRKGHTYPQTIMNDI